LLGVVQVKRLLLSSGVLLLLLESLQKLLILISGHNLLVDLQRLIQELFSDRNAAREGHPCLIELLLLSQYVWVLLGCLRTRTSSPCRLDHTKGFSMLGSAILSRLRLRLLNLLLIYAISLVGEEGVELLLGDSRIGDHLIGSSLAV